MTEQTHAEQQIVVEIIENIFMLKKTNQVLYFVNPSANFKYVGITCSVRLRRFAIHFIYV